MAHFRFANRTRTVALLALLIVECLLVVCLRRLGWFGTGHAIQVVGGVFVAVLPLLLAVWAIAGKRFRFRFNIRSALAAVTLAAVFLTVSLTPLIRYRSARSVSTQLLAAKATLNEDFWNDFYKRVGFPAPVRLNGSKSSTVPPWLTALTKASAAVPLDHSVHSICFTNDRQIRIFADHWERFSSLQSVSVISGVTERGFRLLEETLPRLEHLDAVLTSNAAVPEHWYRSLTNVRTLFVWGEGASRGQPFSESHLEEIAALPNLEVMMVLGYAFDDADAGTLANSASLRRIILRGTAVTPVGESRLSNEDLDRIVYRN